MKILAIECSAAPVSAAVISEGNTIVSSAFSNVKLTHSQTLFPLIKNVLDSARITFKDIDAIGVAVGPGSFTGLRIGISSAKGLAEPRDLKCAGVSSLEAAAYMFSGGDAVICPVIDARCGQVYNALFDVSENSVTRLCEDRALMIENLLGDLETISRNGDRKIILCCDAANAVMTAANGIKGVKTAPVPLLYQNAAGVGLCAAKKIEEGNYVRSSGLMPVYLKLPQAERELKAKL